ncbi:hypothetical protein BO99DRAFT_266018 [Aspergillus violaceofuscus CBS 115571]|uniref:Uncharacterized protein n=1 Tax=Aspergillus violaceofuscus (strain CBS 115571) TaxID=1450538 RepID=A0A2V5I642_ASPV1|nr:hypothetical protein BO99DRAFT_266018 [Aspergillus violaceofuscus CBS 115571]
MVSTPCHPDPGPCGGRENPRQVWSRVFGSFGCFMTVACQASDKTIEFQVLRSSKSLLSQPRSKPQQLQSRRCEGGGTTQEDKNSAPTEPTKNSGRTIIHWLLNVVVVLLLPGRNISAGCGPEGKELPPSLSPLIPANSHHGLSDGVCRVYYPLVWKEAKTQKAKQILPTYGLQPSPV